MTYLLACIVLLLAVAVIVLFAMLGELSARVGAEKSEAQHTLRLMPTAFIGRRADEWPAELRGLGESGQSALFVLSSSCTSCASIAQALRDDPAPLAGWPLGIVISAPDAVRGREFFEDHPALGQYPTFVDVGGTWVGGQYGISTSPSVLAVVDGELVSAYGFTDISTLREASVFAAKESLS